LFFAVLPTLSVSLVHEFHLLGLVLQVGAVAARFFTISRVPRLPIPWALLPFPQRVLRSDWVFANFAVLLRFDSAALSEHCRFIGLHYSVFVSDIPLAYSICFDMQTHPWAKVFRLLDQSCIGNWRILVVFFASFIYDRLCLTVAVALFPLTAVMNALTAVLMTEHVGVAAKKNGSTGLIPMYAGYNRLLVGDQSEQT
jgi:hypothetical protein